MKYIICRMIHSWYFWRYHECLSPYVLTAGCTKCKLVWQKRGTYIHDDEFFHCIDVPYDNIKDTLT